MKNIIPYEHDIKFDTKISEITSISLEHEDKITPDGIMGDFIISGDYKTHNISVNKEEFKYRLPFSVELPDRVINDSIKYDITDFTYDIKDDDTLTVKIELSLSYDEIEEIDNKEDIIDVIEDTIERDEENEIEVTNHDNIINNINNNVDTYINYHVYNIKLNDNLDDIAKTYNSSKEIIMEYNNIEELKEGMKIIIPEEINE